MGLGDQDSLRYEDDLAAHRAAVSARFGEPMLSTMGHPLSASEEMRIRLSWQQFQESCLHVPSPTDSVTMLKVAQDMISMCHDLRRAIYDGWHGANNRAIPSKPRVQRAQSAEKAVSDLLALGLSQNEISNLIKDITNK